MALVDKKKSSFIRFLLKAIQFGETENEIKLAMLECMLISDS